jgi:hypothetical protein
MIEGFFQLRSPRDMYEKAKREFARMKLSPNIDTVFNFYVTAYHVKDYVEKQTTVPETAIKAFLADQAFQMCGYICNKGKHLELTRSPWKDYPFKTQHNPGALFDGAPFDEVCFDASESYCLVVDGKETNVVALGQQLLEKWEVFFKDNGI